MHAGVKVSEGAWLEKLSPPKSAHTTDPSKDPTDPHTHLMPKCWHIQAVPHFSFITSSLQTNPYCLDSLMSVCMLKSFWQNDQQAF